MSAAAIAADGGLVQLTLDGDQTAKPRQRPSTLMWCPECESWILRRERVAHPCRPHDAFMPYPEADDPLHDDGGSDGRDLFESGDDADDDSEEETVYEAGAWYDVTLSYSVDYRFRIPAPDRHAAERRAKDLKFDATPTASDHVHTRVDEGRTIYEDDDALPDDWTVGAGPLWEAIDDD